MRSLFGISFTFLASTLVACSSSDANTAGTAPVISELNWAPQRVQSGPASQIILGTLRTNDAERDVIELHVVVTPPGGTDTEIAPIAVPNPNPAARIELTVEVQATFRQTGAYGFRVWARDAGGRDSNSLSGQIESM